MAKILEAGIMQISRRDFLKTAAAIGAAAGIELTSLQDALGATNDPRVIWLQGQGCTGCSVSFLNSIYYASAADVLVKVIDLEFHSTLIASAGSKAWNYALSRSPGFILVVEGAIPTGAAGKYCTVGGDMTVLNALKLFAQKANCILSVGTCASFGGLSAGNPNPTSARSVSAALSELGITKSVVNIPGCPVHPDWLVGTITYILTNSALPSLDSYRRPKAYFGAKVHDKCPNLSSFNAYYAGAINHSGGRACLKCHSNTDEHIPGAKKLGQAGCLFALNCKGRQTYADCPTRKWNSPGTSKTGVNWCVGGKSPCHGCTQPNFPDGMSPFFALNGNGVNDD